MTKQSLSIPNSTPVVDKNGKLTQNWLIWFNNLYKRVGESNGDSVGDLTEKIDIINNDIESVNNKIDTIDNDIESVNNQIDIIDSQILSINDNIESINNDILNINNNFTDLLETIDDLELRLNVAETNISDLIANQMKMESFATLPAAADYLYKIVYDATNSKPVYSNGTTWLDLGGAGGSTNLSTTYSSTTVTINSDTGTDATVNAATTSNAGVMSAADKTKLDGIEAGATANQTDSYLLNRANHTGSQAISTVTGLQTALDGKQATLVAGSGINIAGNVISSTSSDLKDIFKNIYAFWQANNNSTTITAIGSIFNFSGATAVSSTGGSKINAIPKLRISTTATSGNSQGVRALLTSWRDGSMSKFRHQWIFGIETTTSDHTCCHILHGSNNTSYAFGNLTGLNNCIGFGYNNTDANIQFIYADSSNVLQKIDLGTNFPARTAGALYRATVSYIAGIDQFTVTLDRLDSAFTYTNTITSTRPLGDLVQKSFIVNAVAAIKTFVITSMYIDQDI